MKFLLVLIAAITTVGCVINTVGDSCAPQVCRIDVDGACLVGRPVCCGPSGPKCGPLHLLDGGGPYPPSLTTERTGCVETIELGFQCE